MIPVRQSTAFETAIGPILDADGVAVTGGVVGDFKIKKTTGNFAALNGSATLTHVSAGVYDLVLTTSDTDTVGTCVIAIDDTVNACASIYLQVMEEAVYDALYAASANAWTGAAGSSVTSANAVQIQSSSAAATGLSSAGTHYGTYSHFDSDQNLLSSAITSVTSQTIFVLTSGVATDDFYNDMMVNVTGVDAVTERHRARVVDYVGSTKTLTIDTAAPWTVNTSDEINIIAVPRQVTYLPNVAAGGTNGVFIAGTNAATTVTTALTTTFTGNLTGSVDSVTGAVGSVTGNVGGNVTGSVGSVVGAVGSVTGAVGSVTGNVGGNVVGSVASVTGNVGGNVTGSVGSVVGAVGSVTGNVGGNVTGTVASVVGNVGGNVTGSVGSVVGAVGSVTGNVGGNVVGSVGSVTGLTASNLDATISSRPTLAQILAGGDVDGYTLEQTLKICLAALAGKLSGAATTTIIIRSADDTANRIVATVDSDGNRSAVTLDAAG